MTICKNKMKHLKLEINDSRILSMRQNATKNDV